MYEIPWLALSTTGTVCGSIVFKKIVVKINIESRKFANGPANIIDALCHLGFESKVFFNCSADKPFTDSGSSSINLFVIIDT